MSLSALRFERDQHDVVFTEIELLLEFSVAANLHGADIDGIRIGGVSFKA